jgi:alpha-galactosidase
VIIEGWNGYNHFHNRLTEKLVQQIADAMVATGLAALGYEYGLFFNIFLLYPTLVFFLISLIVNIDDEWQVSRDSQGIIQPDYKAFPSGMRALADYIHSKKLKFGLYSGI